MFRQARLDHIAKAGLPIWGTELDLAAPDEKSRADWLDTPVIVNIHFFFSLCHEGVCYTVMSVSHKTKCALKRARFVIKHNEHRDIRLKKIVKC